jgi:hypothetical protein
MREERIGLAERPVLLPLHDDVADAGDDRRHERDRFRVEVRDAGGQLAQHDGREPRPLRRFLDDGLDPGVDLLFRGAGAVGNRPRPAADGSEHVAEDLVVELELAAEVVVDHRLVDAGFEGDAVDAGSLEPAGGEFRSGGGKNAGPRVARRLTSGHSGVNQPVS